VTQSTLQETERLSKTSKDPEKKGSRILWLGSLFGGLLLIGVAVLGIYLRNVWTSRIAQRTTDSTKLFVKVIHPTKSTGALHVQLPGQTMPYTDAPIFAQTSGYLKKWYFDIGAKVRNGDVLAEIDTPAIDQQFAQAQAQLKVAQAVRDLSEVTFKRFQDLYNRKVIAAQDFDTAADNFRGNQSTVIADQAIVKRLEALEAFKILRAPFDGIVTARNTDIGAYISAGSGTQLFRVARISPLRVYVQVPQAISPYVKEGTEGFLTLDQFPGRQFLGRVVGTAGALNPTTKTLLTELHIPNQSGELFPGAYGQILFSIDNDPNTFTIPANTVLIRPDGPAVAVVLSDQSVEIRKITVGRDLGTELEVSKGVSASDELVVSPSDSLDTGMKVSVEKPKPT
jgi:RND family efflux transporter MFP subunit